MADTNIPKDVASSFTSIFTNINFEKCLNDQKIEDLILDERIKASKKYKIDSTPTVIINDKKFEKSLNYKNLKKTLEKLI